MTMPALFAGHGSPINIIERNAFAKAFDDLAPTLPKPKAILVASAHWMTRGTFIAAAERPQTIHDFYGFPEELYKIEYPALGQPELARDIASSLTRFGASCEFSWGLDHGAWAILRRLFPKADVPTLQLSLDYSPDSQFNKPLEHHFELACELRRLRSKGVLVIGSGNIVHNLQLADYENEDAEPFPWAVDFDAQVKESVLANDIDALLHPERFDGFKLSVPTWDHYLPLVYALAMKEPSEKASFPFEGFQNGSISMRAVRFG